MCRTLVPALVEVAPNAVIVMVTNPVDIVTTVAIEAGGLPDGRVFGSGTVLDSSRFRHLLAGRCGVAVQNVHAYIVGEHGDSEFPLWSSASIGGIALDEWIGPNGHSLTADEKESIAEEVRQLGATHHRREGRDQLGGRLGHGSDRGGGAARRAPRPPDQCSAPGVRRLRHRHVPLRAKGRLTSRCQLTVAHTDRRVGAQGARTEC